MVAGFCCGALLWVAVVWCCGGCFFFLFDSLGVLVWFVVVLEVPCWFFVYVCVVGVFYWYVFSVGSLFRLACGVGGLGWGGFWFGCGLGVWAVFVVVGFGVGLFCVVLCFFFGGDWCWVVDFSLCWLLVCCLWFFGLVLW